MNTRELVEAKIAEVEQSIQEANHKIGELSGVANRMFEDLHRLEGAKQAMQQALINFRGILENLLSEKDNINGEKN